MFHRQQTFIRCLVVFSRFKTSPHLLQLFGRMLQHCLAVKLQEKGLRILPIFIFIFTIAVLKFVISILVHAFMHFYLTLS